MTLIAAILAVLMQAAPSPEPAPAPEVAPAMEADEFAGQDVEVLEAGIDTARRMTIPVMIDGNGPYRFFVDTGSQSTVVSRELGDQLNLPHDGMATLVSVAERTRVDLVQLDGLELGSRVIDGLSAPMVRRRDLGADGIIGIDSLQDLRVQLDFRENTLAVVDSRRPGMADGYEIVVRARTKLGRMIVTNAEIDGISTVVIIDTGAQASIGNLALKRRLRGRADTPVVGMDVVGTRFDANFGKTRKLRVGDIVMPQILIGYSDALVFSELGLANKPALLLGVQDLRLFDRVAIDFAERKVLFDLPAGVRREPPMMGIHHASKL